MTTTTYTEEQLEQIGDVDLILEILDVTDVDDLNDSIARDLVVWTRDTLDSFREARRRAGREHVMTDTTDNWWDRVEYLDEVWRYPITAADLTAMYGADGVPAAEPSLRLAAELDRLIFAAMRSWHETGRADLDPVFAALAALPHLPELPNPAGFAAALAEASSGEQINLLSQLLP